MKYEKIKNMEIWSKNMVLCITFFSEWKRLNSLFAESSKDSNAHS